MVSIPPESIKVVAESLRGQACKHSTHQARAAFIGLTNDNDFFSAHYLAEVFQGDFAEVVKDSDSIAGDYHGLARSALRKDCQVCLWSARWSAKRSEFL